VKPSRFSRILLLLAGLAAAAALVPGPASAAPQGSASTLATLQSAVLVQLNRIRVQHGLVPLRLNRALSAAADMHRTEMLANGYFAHASADGSSFSNRLAHFYAPGTYSLWGVGENLIWADGDLDATNAVQLWMASPEHRANILSPRWRELGIAALAEPDAPGTFGGETVTLITTDFGVRR
jgi:uncharacterized protein YkwD